MKTLKSMLAGLALLLISVAANATAKPVADKLTKDDVIKVYIDAINLGKTKNLDKVIDDNLQFNMQRGDNVNTLNKDQFMSFIKNNTPTGQQVITTTTVMQDEPDSSVIKIEFKYDGYTRTDVVTLTNSAGWTVTNVNTSTK